MPQSDKLESHALIDDALMNIDGFSSNSSMISGITPTGNVSIIGLIKHKQFSKAFTCHDIDGGFRDNC